jgi:hypothetical protein
MIPKSGVRFSDKDHAPRKLREAERRKAHASHCRALQHGSAPMQTSVRSLRNSSASSGALAFRRFAAALAPASERQDSAQAALHASGRMRALPAPSFALKRSTSRSGHNAGGAWQLGFGSLHLRKLRPLPVMPGPPGSGVTSPARRNRTRSAIRCVSRSRPSDERDGEAVIVVAAAKSKGFDLCRSIKLFRTARLF